MTSMEDLPAGEPISVSATLFVTYQACPQQALGRLQGIYGPPSRASFKGLLAHRVFARHLNEGEIPPEALAQVCKEETGQHLNGPLADLGLRPSEFNAVAEEVAELYGRFKAFPTDGFQEAEAELDVAAPANVTIRGRVDAVFEDPGGVRIVDWKTGKELNDDAENQLAFYAWAWELAEGEAPTVSEAFSVTTGERLVKEFSADDRDDIEALVVDMVVALREALASGTDLERTGGPHCRWCPLLVECDEGSTALSLLN